MINRLRNFLEYRTARRQLEELSDRQLKDLGINRGDIERIAHGSST